MAERLRTNMFLSGLIGSIAATFGMVADDALAEAAPAPPDPSSQRQVCAARAPLPPLPLPDNCYTLFPV